MALNDSDVEKEAKEALGNIIDCIGADPSYKENAQLITYIKWAIKRTHTRGY